MSVERIAAIHRCKVRKVAQNAEAHQDVKATHVHAHCPNESPETHTWFPAMLRAEMHRELAASHPSR